ncbi:hypothetical protein NMY22_g13321 [Coprinellus aureogranulatus]|nr:hypothetical protein NMY22_g13321 [Coprinellus aureogranulatus]
MRHRLPIAGQSSKAKIQDLAKIAKSSELANLQELTPQNRDQVDQTVISGHQRTRLDGETSDLLVVHLPLCVFFLVFLSVYLGRSQACERECMSGVTNAFNGNYTIPVQLTILSLADRISSQLLPNNPAHASYLDPLVLAYNKQAFSIMEKAIFPSFFHGKCQDPVTGNNPPGCPNPDCPVVCGTPGSMVHFYPRLRYIAFNTTFHLLHDIVRSGSPVFNQIQANVETLRNSVRHRDLSSQATGSKLRRYFIPEFLAPPGSRFAGRLVSRSIAQRDNYVKDSLARIFQDMRSILEKICGGDGGGNTNSLPYCSWEQTMKEYILTFP